MPENIKLAYPVIVNFGLGHSAVSFHAASAEVFKDEHGIQWIKFLARTGFYPGKEHMARTDSEGFYIVRDDDREAVQIG